MKASRVYCTLYLIALPLVVTSKFPGSDGFWLNKIAGRKRPARVDPSHKVRQGGKGSVWDGTVITLGSKATNSPPQERGVQGGGATLKGHRATDTRWTDTGRTLCGCGGVFGRTPDRHRTDNKFCVTH